MMRKLFPVILICFTSCAAKIAVIPETPSYNPRNSRVIELYQLLDHKNFDVNDEIPFWADLYLDEGIAGIEGLPEYSENYLFVIERNGTNFRTLQQWSRAFSTARDLPFKVASRVEERLLGAASQFPDDEYGDFFEKAVEAAANAAYPGAAQQDDFWLQRRFFEEDGITVRTEVYTFLILISIDKPSFEQQLRQILNETVVVSKPAKGQAAAVSRIKENFFEGF
jgi:hypothetical protein